MSSQIEILAALQTLDREIKRQNTVKQEILGDVQGRQKAIDAIKREIAALKAAFAEKEKLRQEKDRVFEDEGKSCRSTDADEPHQKYQGAAGIAA